MIAIFLEKPFGLNIGSAKKKKVLKVKIYSSTFVAATV